MISKKLKADSDLSHAEWLGVLCVAHRFNCPTIHARATRQVTRIPVIPNQAACLLGCAEAHGLDVRFLEQALTTIITRPEPLSSEELECLSRPLAARIACAREKWARLDSLHTNSPVPSQPGQRTNTKGGYNYDIFDPPPCEHCGARTHRSPKAESIITEGWGARDSNRSGAAVFCSP
ncbi:hypothetical protein PENSPDRAFT_228753 [Peniophora sp. CONT]|nr:hypothetical protein PENSPDRAFT_228753 [Peniophora sp. CONT]